MALKSLNLNKKKFQAMNFSLEINKIKHDLEELHDEKLVETVKTLLDFARKSIYESSLKPMSVEEYKERAFKSENDIEHERVTNANDL